MKNTLKKNLINKYNNQDSILVISPYPEKGIKYGNKVCAVAGFTKNTVDSLKEHYQKNGVKAQFVVLTIKIDQKEELYEENGILVWRIFERNNPLSYFDLIKAVSRFSKIKDTLIGFEFASFGNTLTTALFPLLQFVLRLQGKKTTVVIHQVVADFAHLLGHLGWKKSPLKTSIYNLIVRMFLSSLILFSNKVVVLEGIMKKRLSGMVGFDEKIHVIPHGIDKQISAPSKISVRKQLKIKDNELVLLYFGYLTWYKGVDFLIKSLAGQKEIKGKKIRLIIAGGDSVTQKTKTHYRKFVDSVYKSAKNASQVTITGFVPEEKIAEYFSASDLVILPYRAMISSSGPLSLATGFSKPFIFSDPLKGYFESEDFCASLKETGLNKNDLLFALNKKSLIAKIESVMNLEKLTALSKFASLLAKKRDFRSLAPEYAKVIDHNREAISLSGKFLDQGLVYGNIV